MIRSKPASCSRLLKIVDCFKRALVSPWLPYFASKKPPLHDRVQRPCSGGIFEAKEGSHEEKKTSLQKHTIVLFLHHSKDKTSLYRLFIPHVTLPLHPTKHAG